MNIRVDHVTITDANTQIRGTDSQRRKVKSRVQTQVCLLNFDISYITQLCRYPKYRAGDMVE